MSLSGVPDWHENGFRGKGVSLWSFSESSIEIQSQEPWNGGIWSCCGNFIKIQPQEHCHDTTYPPSPLLESWSIGWFLTTWRWCHMTCINPLKLLWKISSKSNVLNPMRTYMSSKSLSGVLEDIEVPDKPGDGVRSMGASLWPFCEGFIKNQHLWDIYTAHSKLAIFIIKKRLDTNKQTNEQ